jgi:putative protease
MNAPELLAPAGTSEKLTYAFAYGADAAYAGVPRYSLRARENDFTEATLIKAIEYSHKLGKKIYLTMNIFPHNRKVNGFTETLTRVAKLKPDGLIMSDPGMIMIARENHPELDVHLSTQANAINWQTVRFWQKMGLTRIILSRELNLDEIKEIKQKVPEMELETFVHGAICIAYSGRCLLSNYFTHRDANQGTCTNACRWEYNIHSEPAQNSAELDAYKPIQGSYYLEEGERPGELMPVDEDEHGTYIMNAKDLSAIHILKDLTEAGIDSLKIEGRTKSIYYLSVITRAYRMAIRALKEGLDPQEIYNEVFAVANRGYISGFLEKNPQENGQNYLQSHSSNQSRKFAGIVSDFDSETHTATIKVRNRFKVGDAMELMTPETTTAFTVGDMKTIYNEVVDTAHGGADDVRLTLPADPGKFGIIRKVV